MEIRAHASLVCEVNLRLDPASLCANRRILLLQPLIDQGGVLLIRPEQRLLSWQIVNPTLADVWLVTHPSPRAINSQPLVDCTSDSFPAPQSPPRDFLLPAPAALHVL